MQLSHDEKETDRENHGWVKIIAADGEVIVEDDKYQHNRNYEAMKETADQFAATVAEYNTGYPAEKI